MTHFVNSAARQTYAMLSTAELRAQLAKVEENGKKAKAALRAPVAGAPGDTIAVRAGRFERVVAAEVALNVCREMWKDLRTILDERENAHHA